MSSSKFSVEVDGVSYQCMREITGKYVLHQTIYVEGFGVEDDSNQYGYNLPSQPLHLMEAIAKQIARSIINAAPKERGIKPF
jgi:hypothetical protein